MSQQEDKQQRIRNNLEIGKESDATVIAEGEDQIDEGKARGRSFIVALTKGWLLSLILMSSIPLIAAAGAAMSLVIFKSSNSGQKAYAQAGTMVEHTVGSIRTLIIEKGYDGRTIFNVMITVTTGGIYKKLTNKSYKVVVGEGTASSFRMSVVIFILFCSYGLVVWYDAKLIIEKGYGGRTIFNVMIVVTIGGMSLGQASPCLSSFASGQAAAYQMFETINQIPSIYVYDTSDILLEEIKGDVELRDVHFSYPSRSSSGKSTVIRLVERFYDPQVGEINDEKKAALAAQFVAKATLRRVYAAQKDDDTPPIEAILVPLEAKLKLARQELPYGHSDTDLYNACYDLISFEQTVPYCKAKDDNKALD
ncbi:hypothetical protein ZIOFF_050755 [Zingiber officinale]|uniref:ABC transmembrane type-1 domain-containing protein n=1 Tax=Zingiber officinale TaxID=94328 RepID=A0A8J5FRI6_ZINOF|nr:hypothetical protein ZIOFF_050755 [Zingiber officinale]